MGLSLMGSLNVGALALLYASLLCVRHAYASDVRRAGTSAG